MNRWERAQEAEMQFKRKYYQSDREPTAIADSMLEYRAIGVDPLTVTGRVVDIGGAQGSLTVPLSNAAERIVVIHCMKRSKSICRAFAELLRSAKICLLRMLR